MVMNLPDDSPAAGVPINITVSVGATQLHWQGTTDQEGAVSPIFNIPNATKIAVEVSFHKNLLKALAESQWFSCNFLVFFFMQVSAAGIRVRKFIPAVLQTNNYLHMEITHKVYSVNDFLTVQFNTFNGPSKEHIYYIVRPTCDLLQQVLK